MPQSLRLLLLAACAAGAALPTVACADTIKVPPGAVLVGPLPEPIRHYTTCTGALSARTARSQAAQALLATRASPDAAATIRGKGMAPVR